VFAGTSVAGGWAAVAVGSNTTGGTVALGAAGSGLLGATWVEVVVGNTSEGVAGLQALSARNPIRSREIINRLRIGSSFQAHQQNFGAAMCANP
jgi:hypothetical protein